MTKEDLIQLLKEYNENTAKLELRKREKKMLELRINAEKEVETNITNSYGINNDIRSKNSTSDKVGNAVIENESKKEEDIKKLDEINKIIAELEDKVAEVNIRLKRTIL